MEKDVVKGHAQWRQPELKEKIDTQTRRAPGAPVFVGGGGPVFSAYVAEEYNRISGRGLTEDEERTISDFGGIFAPPRRYSQALGACKLPRRPWRPKVFRNQIFACKLREPQIISFAGDTLGAGWL